MQVVRRARSADPTRRNRASRNPRRTARPGRRERRNGNTAAAGEGQRRNTEDGQQFGVGGPHARMFPTSVGSAVWYTAISRVRPPSTCSTYTMSASDTVVRQPRRGVVDLRRDRRAGHQRTAGERVGGGGGGGCGAGVGLGLGVGFGFGVGDGLGVGLAEELAAVLVGATWSPPEEQPTSSSAGMASTLSSRANASILLVTVAGRSSARTLHGRVRWYPHRGTCSDVRAHARPVGIRRLD